MKVTEKKLEDGLILLDAVVSTAEVSHALTMAQYGFAQQMGIQPQPGKPVAQAVEEQMGIKDLDAIVQQQAIEYLVPFAIDKRNIMPAYPPQPKAKEPLKRGQTFSFELRVAPKPEYELTSYDQVTITVPSLEVPESEVDAQIAQMAESYAEFVADEPHPVGAGDSMMLALEAFQGGKRIDNLSTDGRTYLMGMGLMPEAFESNLMGMEVGETKSFSFELPTGAGEQVETMDCTVTIKEIQKKIVPEIDDAWVEKNMPMYRNAAALRGGIADRIHADYMAQYEGFKMQMVAAELGKRFQGRIADEVYESMRSTLMSNLRGQLQQQGVPFEQFVESQGGEQQFGMMTMMQTREMLVQGYALDALFRHEKMTLTDEDIEAACRQMNPQNPKAARREMEESGRGFALREAAERMKANRWLLEHAIVNVEQPAVAE
ncbi:trigger factor [Paraeggerthella hongkongensis]|uniref:Trigger factor n=1 Tax=Paraeggerthella hongkongensis TaxID=230658 RepID=A0A3N0B335_9ACTN|nr:trigger factor [Paraeggerthella hongkongensis]RNL41320.1 trigger factor [Paraeggerthella hongkongensis]